MPSQPVLTSGAGTGSGGGAGGGDGDAPASHVNPLMSQQQQRPAPVASPAPAAAAAATAAATAAALPSKIGFASLMQEMSAATKVASKLRQRAATGAYSEFATSMDATPGIPVREMMTQVFVHERARSAKEFVLYFLYVCIFLCCVWQITDTNTVNMTNGSLQNMLLSQEFQPVPVVSSPRGSFYFKKTFYDIDDYDELRQWLSGVLVDALYDDANSGFLLGGKYYHLRGGARIWQMRVSNGTCSDMQKAARDGKGIGGDHSPFLRSDQTCYSYWDDKTRERSDWSIVLAPRVISSEPLPVTCNASTAQWVFSNLSVVPPSLLRPPGVPLGDDLLPESCVRTYKYYQHKDNGDDSRVFAYGQYGWGATDFGLVGGQTTYGRAGYVAFLPPKNKSAAAAIVADLTAEPEDGGWIDAQTRLILVDFTVYNYDTGYITTARLQVEMHVTGYVMPSFEFFTYRAALYMTWYDYARAVGEVLLVLGCCRYIFKAAVVMARRRRLTDKGALFELAVQVLVMSCIGFWIKVILPITAPGDKLMRTQLTVMNNCSEVNQLRGQNYNGLAPFFGQTDCWVDMYPVAQDYKYAVTFAGSVGLLMALKFFSYFSIYRSLSLLWLTLARAGLQLLAFTFGFSLLVGGFAFMGQMCFGHSVPAFHTWLASFSTLLRYPLGDFNYDALSRARPEVSGLFFALYMALVFLVCINMVVAIITISFEEVNIAVKVDEKWKHAGRSFFGDIISHFRLLFLHAARCVALRGSGGRRGGLAGHSSSPRWPVSAASSVAADSRGGGDDVADEAGGGAAAHDDWWGAEELAVLCADAYYNELMRVFIETSEYTSRADLMKYAEEVYHSSTAGINYYIGLGELCEMARDPRFLPEPFCSAMHLESSSGGGSPSAGGGTPPTSPRARIPVSRFRSSRLPLSPTGAAGTTAGARFVSSPAGSAAAPPAGCCGCAGGGGAGDDDGGCGDLDAWKTVYINHIDFLVPPAAAPGGGGGAPRPRRRRSGWCCLYFDFFTPVYRALLVAGLPAELRAAAAAASSAHRCVAFRLVQAYKATRRVLMLGRTRRHQWIAQRQGTKPADNANTLCGSWKVWKIGPLRAQRKRVLSIVQESAGSFVLYNNEGGAERRLRRRLLLTQVVQLDAPVYDGRRLFAFIEARERPLDAVAGSGGRGASGHGGLGAGALGAGGAVGGASSDQYVRFDVPADSMYDLLFDSQEQRNAFVAKLVECRTLMQQARVAALSAALRSVGGGAGEASMGVVVAEPAMRPSELRARAAGSGGGGGGGMRGGGVGSGGGGGGGGAISALRTQSERVPPRGGGVLSHQLSSVSEGAGGDDDEAASDGLSSTATPRAGNSNRSLSYDGGGSGSSPGSVGGSRDKAHFHVNAVVPSPVGRGASSDPDVAAARAAAARQLDAALAVASRLSLGDHHGTPPGQQHGGGGGDHATAFEPQPHGNAAWSAFSNRLLAAARRQAAAEAEDTASGPGRPQG